MHAETRIKLSKPGAERMLYGAKRTAQYQPLIYREKKGRCFGSIPALSRDECGGRVGMGLLCGLPLGRPQTMQAFELPVQWAVTEPSKKIRKNAKLFLTVWVCGAYIRLTNDGGDAAGEQESLSLVLLSWTKSREPRERHSKGRSRMVMQPATWL